MNNINNKKATKLERRKETLQLLIIVANIIVSHFLYYIYNICLTSFVEQQENTQNQ